MFGSTSGWGQNNQQQQQQPQQQGGGLFGGGGGFGQPQQQQNTGERFSRHVMRQGKLNHRLWRWIWTAAATTGSWRRTVWRQYWTNVNLWWRRSVWLLSHATVLHANITGGFGAAAQQPTNTFGAARPTFGATGTSSFGTQQSVFPHCVGQSRVADSRRHRRRTLWQHDVHIRGSSQQPAAGRWSFRRQIRYNIYLWIRCHLWSLWRKASYHITVWWGSHRCSSFEPKCRYPIFRRSSRTTTSRNRHRRTCIPPHMAARSGKRNRHIVQSAPAPLSRH